MFWNVTVRRLAGGPTALFPSTWDARPDLAAGPRLLAFATEGGVLLTLSGPPASPAPPSGGTSGAPAPRLRSTVNAPAP